MILIGNYESHHLKNDAQSVGHISNYLHLTVTNENASSLTL